MLLCCITRKRAKISSPSNGDSSLLTRVWRKSGTNLWKRKKLERTLLIYCNCHLGNKKIINNRIISLRMRITVKNRISLSFNNDHPRLKDLVTIRSNKHSLKFINRKIIFSPNKKHNKKRKGWNRWKEQIGIRSIVHKELLSSINNSCHMQPVSSFNILILQAILLIRNNLPYFNCQTSLFAWLTQALLLLTLLSDSLITTIILWGRHTQVLSMFEFLLQS